MNIFRTIIQIDALITPTFTWNNKLHGSNAQKFWIFVEDSEDNMILHYEQFVLTKKMVICLRFILLVCFIIYRL